MTVALDLCCKHFGKLHKKLNPTKARSFFYNDAIWKECCRAFSKLRASARGVQRIVGGERPHVCCLPLKRRSNEFIASNNIHSLTVGTKSTESLSISGFACRRKSETAVIGNRSKSFSTIGSLPLFQPGSD